MSSEKPETEQKTTRRKLAAWKSNAWTDLALTLPVFLGYHIGVVLLQVRNAADLVTAQLVKLSEANLWVYWGLTAGIGLALVTILCLLGRGESFEPRRFGLVLAEGVLYAILMRAAAAYAVGSLPMGELVPMTKLALPGRWAGVVMSLGAGFYEEIAFRVGLFGLGALAIRGVFGGVFKLSANLVWAFIAAAIFSGWHYVGPLGEPFELRSFVFRLVCGLCFTAIYVFRGFAPAVWTHALYDIWVLALR